MTAIHTFLNPELASRLQFLFYRYRFVLVYVAFGFLSLCLEMILFRGLEEVGLHRDAAYVLGLSAGIYFAYWMNVRFNFKVPIAKRNRALILFIIISVGSAGVQLLIHKWLSELGWSYELSRFVVSGSVFFLAYLLHRRYSFSDYKQVGVAIYANGVEDIKGIFEKIGACSDFVHVDVIDDTYGEYQSDPKAYRLEVVQAYWPRKPVHIHIMSKTPSKWIEEVAPYVDTIFVHVEIDEELPPLLDRIHGMGKKAGVCVTMGTDVATVKSVVGKLDVLMLLTISVPGQSGQVFIMDALDRIREINQWPERSRFELCVDGGVTEKNVQLLNVEKVVSGSTVLNSDDPQRQILRLQTSSNYERI
jgi:ribulose-phosphate 3-epimerase